MKKIFLFCVLAAIFSVICAQEVLLSTKSSVQIIIPAKASKTVKYAAEELQSALKRILNLNASIKNESEQKASKTVNFFIGPCKENIKIVNLAKLPYDHFIIKQVGNNIHLIGKDDENDPLADYFAARTGSLYAVYRFMNDKLGVRMIFPGSIGEVYPQKTKISISAMNIQDGPDAQLRTAAYGHLKRYTNKQKRDFIRYGRFNGLGSSIVGSVGHASHHLLKQYGKKLLEDHPEYFAMNSNGKRLSKRSLVRSNRWKLCHSNKELANFFANWGINYQPYPDYFPASAMDGGNWCLCKECERLDDKQKSNDMSFDTNRSCSGRMFTFANRVAREVKKQGSQKLVAIYAYAYYVDPPKNISKMEDNVMIELCQGISWTASPVFGKRFSELSSDWAKRTKRIAIRDYWDNFFPMVLYPYPKLASKRLKGLFNKFPNFMGVNVCGDTTQAFSLDGPTTYVYAHILWNKDAKLEDILNDYYTNGWEKSHKTIRQYFELYEHAVYDYLKTQKGKAFFPWNGGHNIQYAHEIYTSELMAKGAQLLAKARSEAKSEIERKRVDYLKIGFDAVSNDLAYYRALMLGATGQIVSIPYLKESKNLTTEQKIEYLNKAKKLAAIRLDFLKKHYNSSAIPAPVMVFLTKYKKSLSSICAKATEKILKDYKSGVSVDGNIIDPIWKFKIASLEKGLENKFHTPEYKDNKWTDINATVLWTSQGYNHIGWAWYRQKIKFPALSAQQQLLLTLGAVDESYKLFVNGKLVKSFKYDVNKNPDSWKQPQTIDITNFIIANQLNSISLAVHNMSAAGGLWKKSYWKLLITPPIGKNLVRRFHSYLNSKMLKGGILDVNLPTLKKRGGARQTIKLNQKEAKAIYLSAESRAFEASGVTNASYSVYMDIQYMDNTYSSAIKKCFTPVAHDWELRQMIFKPKKPIKTIRLYLLFRNRIGHVQFRNTTLIELEK